MFSLWIIHLILIYSLTVSASEDIDDVLKLHLELYKNHCGDVPSCDNDTNNLEPAELVIPVPCCIPCSCLSSCKMKRNCCPELWSRTNSGGASMDPPLENLSKTGSSDFIRNKRTELLEFVPDSNSMNVPLKTTQQKNGDLYGNITSDSIPITDNNAANKTTNLDSTNAVVICIRPQVLYQPNHFLDSGAYKMIVSCKDTFQDKIIAEKCHARREGMDILEMIPVTSSLTGLSYINKYCLICNEAEAFYSSLYNEWEAKYVQYSKTYTHWFIFSSDSLLKILPTTLIGFGNIHFIPDARSLVQTCDTYDVTSCNQTGKWELYDAMIENICHNGHSLPIIHEIRYRKIQRFKNIACVHCNAGSEFNDSDLSCRYFDYHGDTPYSFSQTLNLRNKHKNVKPDWDKIHATYKYYAVIGLPKTKACPLGYLALLGRCRRVICPRDHFIYNNKCEPIYSSITGMALNIKIKITPHGVIPKAVFPEILKELGNMVNKSLSSCTTLQSRDVGIWYGPTSSKHANKYYLFDIFLFNASGSIEYSVGVDEIHKFYDSLKAHDQLLLQNGVKLRLEINFIHSLIARFSKYLDLSIPGDGSLRPLNDQGFNPFERPHMVISNVNWCYRVAFNDVVEGSDRVFYIRSAEINVYQNEYDITFVDYKNGSSMIIMYLCLDMFVNFTYDDNAHRNLNDENGQINRKITTGALDEENAQVKITDPVTVVIVSGLVVLILVTGLCKIH